MASGSMPDPGYPVDVPEETAREISRRIRNETTRAQEEASRAILSQVTAMTNSVPVEAYDSERVLNAYLGGSSSLMQDSPDNLRIIAEMDERYKDLCRYLMRTIPHGPYRQLVFSKILEAAYYSRLMIIVPVPFA